MFDASIIIFLVTLIAITVMLVVQFKKLKSAGELTRSLPSRDLSYETFVLLNKKIKHFWLIFIHGTAIFLTKVWVRLTHYITSFFKKSFKKIEERMIKIERKNGENGEAKQSVFLTTIKTYKHEIRKLKKKAEDEAPRPREQVGLDIEQEKDKIG